jgi:hypothetical protein
MSLRSGSAAENWSGIFDRSIEASKVVDQTIEASKYPGLLRSNASAQAERDGISVVRLIEIRGRESLEMNLVTSRLNLLVDDDIVLKAGFF